MIVDIKAAGAHADAGPGIFLISAQRTPNVRGARAGRILNDEVFEAGGARVPQAGNVALLAEEEDRADHDRGNQQEDADTPDPPMAAAKAGEKPIPCRFYLCASHQ